MKPLLIFEDFAPHVGKLVHFKGTPYSFPIHRMEGQGGEPPPGLKRTFFQVIFRGPKSTDYMREGMYQCEIEGGPTYELYVARFRRCRRNIRNIRPRSIEA